MAAPIGNVVIPGDTFSLDQLTSPDEHKKVLLGPGLREEETEIKVIRPGILRFRKPGVYWVDCHHRRVGQIPARAPTLKLRQVTLDLERSRSRCRSDVL